MHQRSEFACWLLAAVVLAASPLATHAGRPRSLPETRFAPPPEVRGHWTGDTLGDLTLRLVENDPFRLSRRPSRIPFGATAAPPTPSPPVALMPALIVSGIIGPPWRALLHEHDRGAGRLVAAGDTVAGAVVRSIRRRTVTVQLGETTLVLNLLRP